EDYRYYLQRHHRSEQDRMLKRVAAEPPPKEGEGRARVLDDHRALERPVPRLATGLEARDLHRGARSGEAEDVLHRVEPGGPLGHPAHGAEGAARVRVAAVGAVGELEPLAQRPEGDRVLADHVARAEREDADLLPCALAREALPAVDGDRAEVAAEGLRDDFRHPERGAARRVLLEAMVDLGDLDVVVVAERLRHRAEERRRSATTTTSR